jgi:hypothetical protein
MLIYTKFVQISIFTTSINLISSYWNGREKDYECFGRLPFFPLVGVPSLSKY